MIDVDSEYLELVEDCEKHGSMLAASEVDFVASIRARLMDKIQLTEEQITRLDEVWERATRNG